MEADIFKDILADESLVQRVETQRAGPFTFTPALDSDALYTSLLRVMDAHKRFRRTPLHQVANELEREVVVRSVFGTNTIEGGELDEDETAEAIDLDPTQVQKEQQRRAQNIKLAYDMARLAAEAEESSDCRSAGGRGLPVRRTPGQRQDHAHPRWRCRTWWLLQAPAVRWGR